MSASEPISCKRQDPRRCRSVGFSDPIIVYKTGIVEGAVRGGWNMSLLPPLQCPFFQGSVPLNCEYPVSGPSIHLRETHIYIQNPAKYFLSLWFALLKAPKFDPCAQCPICDYLNVMNLLASLDSQSGSRRWLLFGHRVIMSSSKKLARTGWNILWVIEPIFPKAAFWQKIVLKGEAEFSPLSLPLRSPALSITTMQAVFHLYGVCESVWPLSHYLSCLILRVKGTPSNAQNGSLVITTRQTAFYDFPLSPSSPFCRRVSCSIWCDSLAPPRSPRDLLIFGLSQGAASVYRPSFT